MSRKRRCRALLVYPRFAPNSFWNYQETCEVMGARYPATPLGLITVAAMLPREWELRLVDRNVEDLEPRDLAWADLVLVGGMGSQRRDALRVIDEAHAAGRPVVVGGPDATCSPETYRKADFQVLGEAEEVISEFLAAWASGARGGTFVARRFPDLALSPVPRYDLLRLDRYLHVGVQFSRGCPFDCEFCNVIELNGRTPRTKQPAQVLRELDALHALGYRGHVDFVDDNFIGNRKAAKPFLRELERWLEIRGRPFEFTTKASLDLADDPELLRLMQRCSFFAVFVGIETPDPAALMQANKKQNARRDVARSVQKIHQAGMFVNAGFILGFDGETGSIGAPMVDCIEKANIPICMVGLLYALPGTRLARRLKAEGRLDRDADIVGEDDADQCTSGLNFSPCRPRVDVLSDYREVLARIYAPGAFFGRVSRAVRDLDRSRHALRMPLRHVARDLRGFLRVSWRLGVRDERARRHYWGSLADCLRHNPRAFKIAASFGALYLHFGPLAARLVERVDRELADERDAPHGITRPSAACGARRSVTS